MRLKTLSGVSSELVALAKRRPLPLGAFHACSLREERAQILIAKHPWTDTGCPGDSYHWIDSK